MESGIGVGLSWVQIPFVSNKIRCVAFGLTWNFSRFSIKRCGYPVYQM